MNTKLSNIASIVAATIWADGEYDEAEKIAVSEIADALEIDEKEFYDLVDAEVATIKTLDEEKIGDYIVNAAGEIDDEEVAIVYEAVLQIALSDGVLGAEEVSTLLAIADALGLDTETAVLLLADMVKTEADLEIDFEQSLVCD